MSESRETIEDTLRGAAARLRAKGLMTVGDRLSQRIPERSAVVRIELAAEGAGAPEVIWTVLEGGPADRHHAVYRVRPDVGAVLEARPRWSLSVGRLGRAMPVLFDEQVRHLGVGVPVVAAGALPDLRTGINAVAARDAVLCFGMGLERLLLNAELLEKCAQAFVLAASTGKTPRRIPWWVRLIANRRLLRDERDAADCHTNGRRSVLKAGY